MLQRMFQMLYAKVDIPLDKTISRDVKEIFAVSKKNVANMLQRYTGKIHIGVDGWSSPNLFSFLGIIVFLVQNGEMLSLILDFIRMTKAHTGEHLAEQIYKCLDSFGVTNKLLGQVYNNASNNDTATTELELHMEGGMSGASTQICCICHILNLAVKAILSQFAKSKKDTVAISTSEGSDHEDDEVELDEEDREALKEANQDRMASDAAEVDGIAQEVEKA
ncbi:hypothetical protein EWM64_g10006 [Hericium alpestre]|uniref:DUF659 domain-containing protein n=1 Tax=Hericium alpestre TaxID=135208 RepID=A0A4Y9ZGX8_9AGAM|nr:hypothetical protein EWM64_g10006 [Hericium alpestre]